MQQSNLARRDINADSIDKTRAEKTRNRKKRGIWKKEVKDNKGDKLIEPQ